MTPNSLEARIEQLEKEARRLRRVLLGLLVVIPIAVSLVVSGAQADAPKDIVANSIRVAGKSGKGGATLSSSEDGFVGLYFRDPGGQVRSALLMTPQGKSVLSFTACQVSRLEIGVIDNAAKDGREYSMNLRDADAKVIWRPTVANPFE
jgi:hypothetical protein